MSQQSPRADDKLTYVGERARAGCSPPGVTEWTLPGNAHISTLIGRPGVRRGEFLNRTLSFLFLRFRRFLWNIRNFHSFLHGDFWRLWRFHSVSYIFCRKFIAHIILRGINCFNILCCKDNEN